MERSKFDKLFNDIIEEVKETRDAGQREDVRGRLKDAIVYLMLLWAMVEDDKPKRPSNYQKIGDH